MINFALFGVGFIGSVHAKAISNHPRARLAWVYDVDRETAEKAATASGAKVADSPEQALKASDVDAVLIASSTNTHADLLTVSAKAGKAVLCEKPIDLNIERVRACVAEVEPSGVPIAIGFNRRFDPHHREMYEVIRSGKIGKVEMAIFTSRGPAPPPISYVKLSGGQLRDQTIHFFDLARWIMGEEPVEIYAAGACLVDPEIGKAGDIDTSMVTIRFQSGALCVIDSSRRTGYGYDERIEVFGSEGMVESERQRTHGVSYYKGDKIIKHGLHPGWFERMEPTYGYALDAFVTALEHGKAPSPGLIDGLKAQLMAEAAVKSLQENRPVRLDEV
ncbi:MAG TPA: inositol 2-dehydrogenase [Candidatus Competibacteraceae bacterium]|nr:inositol 2-dehydrogenase [Candidatus Competibacteraceae bacterium]